MNPTCDHCGTPFLPAGPGERYCCKGCECVANMIRISGHERFYDLRRSSRLAPVRSRPFETHDFGWLEEAVARSEESAGGRSASLDCALEGLSCVACVWLVERLFEQHPGGIRAVSNPARGTLHLEWMPGACDIPAFAAELISFGYTPAPSLDASARDTHGLATRTGLCFAFALNAMGFSLPAYLGMAEDFEFASLFRLITFLSATLAMLVGGSWFISRAWRALQKKTVHIDLPISLGVIGAYVGSIIGWMGSVEGLLYFDFVCTFIFLMLGGRWLQTLAVEKNRRGIARRSPLAESVRCEGASIPLRDLATGDVFDLEPGRALPVSASLMADDAEVSLEWIHGESDAVTLHAGANLPAGAIALGRAPVRVRAIESWNDSLLARLTAQTQVERGSPGLQRLLSGYLAVVLVIGMTGLVFWLHVAGLGMALQVMISIFVVSCPCALGVAIPFADERAARLAARAGAFVRESMLWHRLRKVRQIVFDKTGTLTLERPVLENRQALDSLDDSAAAALAILTTGSCHPVSRSLIEALGTRGQSLLMSKPSSPVEERPGMGASTMLNGVRWSLGRPGWMADGEPGTTVLEKGGVAVAAFRFRDTLRPGAAVVLDWLDRQRFKIHILSGDHPEKVSLLAAELHLDPANCHSGLTPDSKAIVMEAIDRSDTLYLGDGANDSLAFDRAWLTGTPVADRSLLEKKADFYTLGDSLHWLPQLFAIGRARSAGIHRAVGFALTYNIAAVAICLAGHMNPLLAAVLMPLSSIVSISLAATTRVATVGNPVHTAPASSKACPILPTLNSASTSAS